MASELNAPGSFFVDEQCIACDACVVEAPKHFKMHAEHAHAYVLSQPKDQKERELCFLAMELCPVEAIHHA